MGDVHDMGERSVPGNHDAGKRQVCVLINEGYEYKLQRVRVSRDGLLLARSTICRSFDRARR